MKKRRYKVLTILAILGVFVFGLLAWYFFNSPEGKAKDDFIENFDLELKGEVLNIQQNRYGQYLVCLKVIESNYENYFPIHDPNKFRSDNSDFWEKRFFIKVQDSLATIILTNKNTTKILHNKIKRGSIIEVNTDGKKGYDVYDGQSKKHLGGIFILTAPIRDNIENSCLERKF
ncbi:hypothetical protein U1E44_08360 [Arenibacter sp. GZD96]|uniref:hypothetical protein n=1 Tax=Aurantibrevibacter litoralis TaxID=3106030 RepID=UPI002AFFBAA5|nr:hypothetical protein [Arenibacter sp. GZD-96]MEA1786100.1 hypothetical protein [Arenibacter sp. GZD-96]